MPSATKTLRAPGKINLYLRVIGRRADGHHLVDSLMLPVSVCDEIQLHIHEQIDAGHIAPITVSSDATGIPDGPANLAYQAAAAFLKATHHPCAIDVKIRKHIPVGSGLGGGSSDAAAVLLALNGLVGRPLEIRQLAAIGAEIGADVPFFVYGRPAKVGGIGEQITQVSLSRQLHLVVCSDGHALSTALVYGRLRASRVALTSAPLVSNIADFVEGRKPLIDLLVNDLEEPAAQMHPGVLALKAKVMEQGAQAALMSGSGSAVFGVWSSAAAARAAAHKLRRAGLWAEAVQTLEISPAVEN